MDELSFVQDAGLRKTIEDSIEFATALREEAKRENKSTLYQEETNRVIILYTVAVIEAILLYLYKRSGKEMFLTEYKFPEQLSEQYKHLSDHGARIVVAVQKKVKREDHQIMMSDLIKFFQEKKWIKEGMAGDLSRTNELRNTFHLSKARKDVVCDTARVESALKLLIDVIENVPKAVLRF